MNILSLFFIFVCSICVLVALVSESVTVLLVWCCHVIT